MGRYPVSINLVLKRIGDAPFWRRGAIDRTAINATARELIARVRHPHAVAATRPSASSPAATSRRRSSRASCRSSRAWWCSTSRRTAWTSGPSAWSASGSGRWPRAAWRVIVISTRPRRADRPVRPGRGAVRGAHRRASWTTARTPRRASAQLLVGDGVCRGGRVTGAGAGRQPWPGAARGAAAAWVAPWRSRSWWRRPRPRGAWAGSCVHAGPIVLAFITCGILLAILGRDPIAFYRDILTGRRAAGVRPPGLHHPHGAHPAHRRRAHRGLPGEPLEPGCGRPVPARGRVRGGRGPVARDAPAAGHRLDRAGAGGRSPSVPPGRSSRACSRRATASTRS